MFSLKKRVAVGCAAAVVTLGAWVPGQAVAEPSTTAVDATASLGVTKSVTTDAGTFSWKDTVTTSPDGEVGVLAGHFSWDATFDHTLESRHYTAVYAGKHTISLNSGSGCKNITGIGRERISVRLYAEDFPGDDLMGSTTVYCDTGGSLVVNNARADTYYFVLHSTNYAGAQPDRVITGNTYYP